MVNFMVKLIKRVLNKYKIKKTERKVKDVLESRVEKMSRNKPKQYVVEKMISK